MARRSAAVSKADATPDLEMRVAPGDHDALRVWLRLMATTNLVGAHVRRRLHEQFDITLPRFDLLAQRYREPRGLKMGELSRRMMVTGGNVTGVAAPLERAGLITRRQDPRDGRAAYLALTDAGRTLFRAMADKHEQWIVEVFAGVTRSGLRELSALLGQVKERARTLEGRRGR